MTEYLIPVPKGSLKFNQKKDPVCVGYACARAQQIKLYNLTGKWIDLSPYSIYGYYDNDGKGMSIRWALVALQTWGALRTCDFPEKGDNPELHAKLVKYIARHPDATSQASRYKLRYMKELHERDFDAVKEEILKNNPVVMSVHVDGSFGKRVNGIEPVTPRKVLGDHAICVFGFTTIKDKEYLVAQNSWGDNGLDGRVYIPRGRKFWECYALTDVGTDIKKKCKELVFTVDSNMFIQDGTELSTEAKVYIKGDRTFVPVRAAAEAMGATITWDAKTATATLDSEEAIIKLTKGYNIMEVDGKYITMDVAPEIKNNRMMLPIRYIAEVLNCDVSWNDKDRQAIITRR